MAKEVFIENHVARRLFPVQPDPKCANKGDIVDYVRKQKVTKVGEGEDDYVVGEEVVEASRVNRKAYIAKDACDVGVMNILEKVRRSGDMTLFNQTHQAIDPELQDYVDVPGNLGDALASLKSGANSFDGLKAIFPNLTFDELAKLDAKQITEYVNKYVASISKPEAKEGEVK